MQKQASLMLAVAVVVVGSGCAVRVGSGDSILTKGGPALGGQPAKGAPGERGDNGGDSVAPADDPADDPALDLPPWDLGRLFTGLRSGHVRGHVGPAAVDAASDLASVYDDGYYSQIEVYALRSDGIRVMLQLAVDSDGSQGPFLQPGVGKRIAIGARANGATVLGLGCEGPDSGDVSAAFAFTDFDEEPCDVGVDTEQDPDDPQALRVTMAATFADDDGNCDDLPGDDDGDGSADLPDDDGDGDGDLPGGDDGGDLGGDLGGDDGGDLGGDAGGDDATSEHPLAVASFVLTRD